VAGMRSSFLVWIRHDTSHGSAACRPAGCAHDRAGSAPYLSDESLLVSGGPAALLRIATAALATAALAGRERVPLRARARVHLGRPSAKLAVVPRAPVRDRRAQGVREAMRVAPGVREHQPLKHLRALSARLGACGGSAGGMRSLLGSEGQPPGRSAVLQAPRRLQVSAQARRSPGACRRRSARAAPAALRPPPASRGSCPPAPRCPPLSPARPGARQLSGTPGSLGAARPSSCRGLIHPPASLLYTRAPASLLPCGVRPPGGPCGPAGEAREGTRAARPTFAHQSPIIVSQATRPSAAQGSGPTCLYSARKYSRSASNCAPASSSESARLPVWSYTMRLPGRPRLEKRRALGSRAGGRPRR